MNIGQRIKSLRELKSLSYRECAHRAGIGKGYLHGIENGITQNPSINVLIRLADVLGCDLNTLAGYKDTPLSSEAVQIARAWDNKDYPYILQAVTIRLTESSK